MRNEIVSYYFLLAFFVPAGCLWIIIAARCDYISVIVLMCITIGVNGFHFSGVSVSHMDISPRYAGTLMGMTNFAANCMGFIATGTIGEIINGQVSTNLSYYSLINMRQLQILFN